MRTVDYVDLLNQKINETIFDRRYTVTELEYKAFKANTDYRFIELVDTITKLSKIYNSTEIVNIAKDAVTLRPFITENMSYSEFKAEWDLYIGGYDGTTTYVVDFLRGNFGDFHMDKESAYSELYTIYKQSGPKEIQKILDHCRETGYLKQHWYANPDAWEFSHFEVKPLEVLPEPPILPPWEGN